MPRRLGEFPEALPGGWAAGRRRGLTAFRTAFPGPGRPGHGPHATWHAINAACNKTELICLLAYYKQIYHAVIWHHGMG